MTRRFLLLSVRRCLLRLERCHLGPDHCVANPESVVRTLLHRFELERNGSVSCGIHAVEDSRAVVASVDAGHQQEADLIDGLGLERSAVEIAAAVEKQAAQADVLAKRINAWG